MPAKTVIQLRRDTAQNWTTTNPVLAAGEFGYESDTNKLKLGDGTSTWTNLDYFVDVTNIPSSALPIVTKTTSGTLQLSDANSIIEVDTDDLAVSSWTTSSLPGSSFYKDIRYRNNTWLISVSGSSLFRSTNGTSWTSITGPLLTDFDPQQQQSSVLDLEQIEYGNGFWLGVGWSYLGEGNKFISSTDGITWSTVTATGLGTTWINRIVYGDGIWVASNQDGTIFSSSNGSTWTTAGSFPGLSVSSIAPYSNGRWVATTTNGKILTSAQGSASWTTVTDSTFGTTAIISVAYGNGAWIAGGNTGQMRRSTNSTTWTTINSNFGTTAIRSIAYGNGFWVAVGYGNISATSTDGISWTTRPTGYTGQMANVAYGNDRFLTIPQYEPTLLSAPIAQQAKNVTITIPQDATVDFPVGTRFTVANVGTGTVALSNDFTLGALIPSTATTWTTVNSTLPSDRITSLSYGNGLWVVTTRFNAQMRTSTNGSTWTTVTSNFGTTRIASTAYGNGLWVAGGYSGQMRISTDGSTWTTVTSGSAQAINAIAYGNGTWRFGTANGEIRVSVSPHDGTNWALVSSNFGTTAICSIAYGNGLWIAAGESGQMRTATGVSWTTVTSNFGTSRINVVAYGNGLWVAVGDGGAMRTSTNGSTWTTVTSNFGTNEIFAVAYGNGLWVAGSYGSGGQMRVSTNGSTWTTVTSNFASAIVAIAYGNSSWIAGGYTNGTSSQIRTSMATQPITNLNNLYSRSSRRTLALPFRTAKIYKSSANTWIADGDLSA